MDLTRLRPGRAVRRFLAIGTFIVLAGVVALNISMLSARRRAESLVSEVRLLRLGLSTAQDAERLFARYGGWKQLGDDSTCSDRECFFLVIPVYSSILERALRGWWVISHLRDVWKNPCCDLTGWRGLTVALRVHRGHIARIEVATGSRTPSGLLLTGRVVIIPTNLARGEPLRPGYSPGILHITTPGGGRGIRAAISDLASDEDRTRAFDLNLRCMSTIRGCSELREVMPSVWEDHQSLPRLRTPDAR